MRIRLTSLIGYKDTERPVGFSWTALIFREMVPLFRGDWFFLGLFILLRFTVDALHYFVWEGYRIWLPFFWGRYFPINIGFSVLMLLPPLFYNNASIKWMLQKGYEPYATRDIEQLMERNIIHGDGSVRGLFGIRLPKMEFLADTPKWLSALLMVTTVYLLLFYQGPQSSRNLLENSYSRPMNVLHEEWFPNTSIVWYQTKDGQDLNVTVRTMGWLGHQLTRNFDLTDSMDELINYGFAYLTVDDFIVGIIENPNIAYVIFHESTTHQQVDAQIRQAGMLRFMHVNWNEPVEMANARITALAFNARGELIAEY
ncbi:MAG: hypothetical protein FWF59_02810 [Turicibacter sp.]|nr:hypothetical protein [Turicibacter sp.]